jgi:uncharacterized membrane protein
MTISPRTALALMVLALSHPAMAHGEKSHQGDEVQSASATEAPSASASSSHDAVGREETSLRQPVEHEADSGSIWTNLHPATVHFPIALLLAAALAELVSLFRPSPRLTDAVVVMAWGGAAGAVVAAAFGWVHTGLWLGGDTAMHWHRWTGTGLALIAPIAAMLSSHTDRRLFRVLLFSMTVALLAQGYWGGELAHGPNHLGF